MMLQGSQAVKDGQRDQAVGQPLMGHAGDVFLIFDAVDRGGDLEPAENRKRVTVRGADEVAADDIGGDEDIERPVYPDGGALFPGCAMDGRQGVVQAPPQAEDQQHCGDHAQVTMKVRGFVVQGW